MAGVRLLFGLLLGWWSVGARPRQQNRVLPLLFLRGRTEHEGCRVLAKSLTSVIVDTRALCCGPSLSDGCGCSEYKLTLVCSDRSLMFGSGDGLRSVAAPLAPEGRRGNMRGAVAPGGTPTPMEALFLLPGRRLGLACCCRLIGSGAPLACRMWPNDAVDCVCIVSIVCRFVVPATNVLFGVDESRVSLAPSGEAELRLGSSPIITADRLTVLASSFASAAARASSILSALAGDRTSSLL